MYNKDYWNRVNLQNITEFIRTGSLRKEHIDNGTAEDLYTKYNNDFTIGMELLRDRIITFDWNSLDDNKDMRRNKTEEFFAEIFEASYNINELTFNIGFVSGIKFWQDVTTKIHEATP